jgi:hypothetical protein
MESLVVTTLTASERRSVCIPSKGISRTGCSRGGAAVTATGREVREVNRLSLLGGILAAVLGFVLVGVTGCGEDKGQFKPNRPPSVQLTATPPDSGIARYDIELHWTAWDYDGEVDYFLYAIDPPDIFGTEDPIWTRIDSYSSRFTFSAADFDTLYPWRNPQVAKGWHVFAIKAVDDLGAISDPEYVAFNAATIAPQTTITSPPPAGAIESYQGGGQPVGLRVTFRWDGEDIDGIFTDKPVGYYYKATDVTGERDWELVAPRVWKDPAPWIRIGAGTTQVTVNLDDTRAYGIAFRAIDEAGAVEPLLLLNKNMLWVSAARRSSFPELTVRSSAFGVRKWQGWTADTEEYEVPLGSAYEFIISGDCGWYGGLVAGYSFGWDLPSLDSNETDPDGIGAWTPWSPTRTIIKAAFTEARDYYLYVRCKDDGGGLTLATIRFNVVTLAPTRNLCYIDDWRKYTTVGYCTESVDDQVWQAMLEGYNYGVDWSELSWDEWDAPYGEEMPSLEFLSQFRVVVWSINDNRAMGADQKSAWFNMNKLSTMNVLAVYMGSESEGGEKGKAWTFGRGLVESSVLPYADDPCEYPYAVKEDASLKACNIRKGSFPFDYFHIVGDFFSSDPRSGGARVNLFDGPNDKPSFIYVDADGPGIPSDRYTRPPAAELYPNLPPKLELHPDVMCRSRIAFCEVLEYPKPDQADQELFYDSLSERMTNLIPIYKCNATSPKSKGHRLYCGFRYVPTGPTDHGEIVYFFFQMFPFKDDQIRATAKVVLSDWFGLPYPNAEPPQ